VNREQKLALAPLRIEWMVVTLGCALALCFLVFANWKDATGALIGAATAWLNFRWMRTSVSSLAAVLAGNVPAGAARALLTLKFLLRYAAVFVVVYATLKCSVASALGVFAGLLLIVPALMFEAVYEFCLSLRKHDQVS
jgi:ATP synthase I chain